MTSSLGQSQKMHLCWARLFWAAHLHREKDSWSTLGWEICPKKQVRHLVMVRTENLEFISPRLLTVFISDSTGKYISTVTEFGCIPVSTAYNTDQFGWMMTRLVYIKIINVNSIKQKAQCNSERSGTDF